MNINLIRLASSIDPKASYLMDSNAFIEDLNNELFDYDHILVEDINSPLNIVFIETGGTEEQFKNIYKKLPEPIILLSNSKNNSLAACFEIKTFLENEKVTYTLLFEDEKSIAISIDKIVQYETSRNKIRGGNLGIIGKPSDWLISSQGEFKKYKEKLGVNLIEIEIEELVDGIKSFNIKDNDQLVKKYSNKGMNVDSIKEALKVYYVLKNIVKKYSLRGLTVRCFDLITSVKCTSCLAFAILNDEGIVATCEGDIPTLLTMYFLKNTINQVGFQANPSKLMINENEGIFSHCTVPFSMCSNYSLITHFESGLGVGVKGELKEKEITFIKFAPNEKDIFVVTGHIKENTSMENYCRTQIKVAFEDDDIYEFLKNPFGNHVVIVYGNVLTELLPYLQLFGLVPSFI